MTWTLRLQQKLALQPPADALAYLRANAAIVRRTIAGLPPHGGKAHPAAGARAVINLPAVHAPAFCNDRYRNGYELGRIRIGWLGGVSRREKVDRALPLAGAPYAPPDPYRRVYFAAAELNGAGIRYFGDYCLVIRPADVHPATVILERNSYDLLLAPIADRIRAGAPMGQEAAAMHGRWMPDLGSMAGLKVLGEAARERLLTTGLISDALLADEDYLEVLHATPVDAPALAEVRTSLDDAAAEERIGAELRRGVGPPLTEVVWRRQRRAAEAAFRKAGIGVRVVAGSGRRR